MSGDFVFGLELGLENKVHCVGVGSVALEDFVNQE
jgi:hypothetical protein